MAKMIKVCPTCESNVFVEEDVEEGEIVSCPWCGMDLTYRKGNLEEIIIEGEDWGE